MTLLIEHIEVFSQGSTFVVAMVANATMFSHLLPGCSCGNKHLLPGCSCGNKHLLPGCSCGNKHLLPGCSCGNKHLLPGCSCGNKHLLLLYILGIVNLVHAFCTVFVICSGTHPKTTAAALLWKYSLQNQYIFIAYKMYTIWLPQN